MTVYFIGAGPGAADLITVRGARALRRCSRCLYAGSLVAEDMLSYLPENAERRSSYGMSLEEIIAFLRESEAAGKNTARLHSGDVSFYSAMGEQLSALKALNIAYEIIPGVPAFAAAAAVLGQELTVPRLSQSLILTRAAGNATPMPESESLAALGAAKAVLIVHLFAQRAEELQRQLLPLYGADCPIVIAARISRPDALVKRGRLSALAQLTRAAGVKRTALLFVGRAVAAENAAEGEQARSRLYAPRAL